MQTLITSPIYTTLLLSKDKENNHHKLVNSLSQIIKNLYTMLYFPKTRVNANLYEIM